MPDKITDNEIIKALRSWLEEIRKSRQAYAENVGEEHYPSMRYEYLLSDTIHAINRLQAENEKLQEAIDEQDIEISRLYKRIDEAKAEAYKECIEKVKMEAENATCVYEPDRPQADNMVYHISNNRLNNLLKELVGEESAENS